MNKAILVVGAVAVTVVAAVLVVGYRTRVLDVDRFAAPPSATPTSTPPPGSKAHPGSETARGFLHGRVTTFDGAAYEGRIRFGGDEEAFWGDTFNGVKVDNPWAAHVPQERLPRESVPVEVLGLEIARRERLLDLGRPFMARFGDIARIEARGDEVRVTLRSGTVFDLDRLSASDFDDGLRVWDVERGVVDLDSMRIRSIEFLPATASGAAPYRLHGTVRTRQGDFAGFVQWDRRKCVGSDELVGRTAEGERLGLRFDTIGSIGRRSGGGSLVTLLDGSEVVLSGTPDVGEGNRGMYVDDARYGRVLISWEAFGRVDFGPGGSGPGYGGSPAGRPLTGTVTSRTGARWTGRLVFDLDESEIVETLDAPSGGIDYTIPFGRIASIVPACGGDPAPGFARVTLHVGEELRLECAGDLGDGNAGMLIFVAGRPGPAYVPWAEVARVDLDALEAAAPRPAERP